MLSCSISPAIVAFFAPKIDRFPEVKVANIKVLPHEVNKPLEILPRDPGMVP